MNKKAISRGHQFTRSRILITVGAVGLLLLILLPARGGSSTNLTLRAFALDTAFTRETLLPFANLPTPAPNPAGPVNQFEIAPATSPMTELLPTVFPATVTVLNDGPAEFFMTCAASNLTSHPAIEGPAPVLGPSVLVLEEPGLQTPDQARPWAEVSLGWGHLMLQLFAPYSHPSPPGERQQSDSDESDRPWPVISAGAANGCTWNEPGLYQAQGLLSLCW